MTWLRWLENGFLVACLAIALPVAGLAQAQAPVAPVDQASREIRPARVTAPPRIDGRLDDEAWAAGALDIGEWTEGSPNYGRPAPYPTRAWVAYDAERLYLAFQCHDPDPVSLRRGVRRRDSGFGDDRVVVQLDPRNSRQRAIRLSSNADGSQMDVAVTRWNDDDAPDWVWESAGRVTANGYVVEMSVPFASIGVPGGASVRVPVLFWRLFTRRGVWATWPDVPDGQSTFDRSATLVLEDVPPQHVRELIPAATYSASQQRQAAGGFPPVSTDGSLGLTGKYGPRPDVILEATLNPDFSQVESDAYQVEVNQRYPIFYSEKRPFFMTGAELYRLARVGFPQNLSWGVHTRRIMDPAWGAKITGSTGPATFAALFAGDSAPGKSTAAGEPGAGTRELFGAGRVQVGLGSSRNVGVIVSTTSFGARRNVALGADLSYRLAAGHLSALVIGTRTETEGQPTLPSAAAGVGYYLRTRRVSIDAAAEHYGHSFAMDTAFVSQIGFTRVSSMNSLYFYPPSIPGVRAASFWLWTAGVR
ncbi:MAG: hypothetical protein EHM24_26740, partial [Acidobacteria bacterium]